LSLAAAAARDAVKTCDSVNIVSTARASLQGADRYYVRFKSSMSYALLAPP
jgi:hypothetical protein